MLSRTAENLYWMSRTVERAENIARILDVSYRMAMLPSVAGEQELHWRPAVLIGPDVNDFEERYGAFEADKVIEYMVLDLSNPSSILSCIASARENARAERTAISSEMWESLNATYLEINGLKYRDLKRWGFRDFFEWVKERSHLFRGVSFGTMYQDEAFRFMRLGTFIERADNTARILDVKYHVLLPETEKVGGYVDYYQWGALLRSVSAFRAYRKAYHDTIYPWRVAQLLILDEKMPRSLHFCFENVLEALSSLSNTKRLECLRLAGEIHSSFRFGKIEKIFQEGLHEYLMGFVRRNNALTLEIQRDFMMQPAFV
jgi:uncharacterized alpha-E superfamily protein